MYWEYTIISQYPAFWLSNPLNYDLRKAPDMRLQWEQLIPLSHSRPGFVSDSLVPAAYWFRAESVALVSYDHSSGDLVISYARRGRMPRP